MHVYHSSSVGINFKKEVETNQNQTNQKEEEEEEADEKNNRNSKREYPIEL